MPEPPPRKEFPDTVIVTHRGLMCKCGHEPRDHKDMEGCLFCGCIWDMSDLTPSPNGCISSKLLLDGQLATLYQEMFTFRILIGPAHDMMGGNSYIEYRYEDVEEWEVSQMGGKYVTKTGLNVMLSMFQEWEGYGYPGKWYRVRTGNADYLYNTPDGKQPGSG